MSTSNSKQKIFTKISKHKNLLSILRWAIICFEYTPKFFDVDALVTDFDIDENHFTFMNAQHIIARLVRFEKWTEILKASPSALELAKLLFDNVHKISIE